jgi:UTP--glucose-1-phosphate uridylyltransferase
MQAEQQILTVMHKAQLPKVIIDNFLRLYRDIRSGKTGEIREAAIRPLQKTVQYSTLKRSAAVGRKNIKKLAVLKLNGGLGTSMGLAKAKTLLEVKPGITFLDIIARQTQKQKLRLILMNSFSTARDTQKFFKKYPKLTVDMFVQNKHPKLYQDTLLPAREKNPALNWNPPGHGDLYPALVTTGTLDRLQAEGVEYLFVSNGDNLGAVVDPAILGYVIEKKIPFLMEVAARTPADRKGGHLAVYKKTKRLMLRELAQCYSTDLNDFQNIKKHKFFNTNSFWINIAALKKVLNEYDNVLPLPLIRNAKTVDPTDRNSKKVYQLETAMGAAIELFDGAQALLVPRTRFAPVKKCSDLLALWSDAYVVNKEYQLVTNPKRKLPSITIELDDKYFGLIKDFKKRMKFIPSLVYCKQLKVSGDVYFNKKMILKGDVFLTKN